MNTKSSDFHLDSNVRIDNQRHAGIVIHKNQILLMQRIYKGLEYWVVPGGHAQVNENGINTVIREIKEETSIEVKNPKLVFEFKNYKKNNFDYYYICEFIKGKPKLGGEENLKNSIDNFYNPKWVNLTDIQDLNILPKFAKEWILENLDTNSIIKP